MNRTARLALALLLLPWIGAGCTSAPLYPSPFAEADVTAAIRHERDRASGAEVWRGPVFESGPVRVLLRGTREAGSGTTTVHLYARHTYRGDWQLYDGASLAGGEPLDFTALRQEAVVCQELACARMEEFGVGIPAERLQQAALVGGLRIHVYHRTGHREIYLPAGYAKAFVATALAPRAAGSAEATGAPLARNPDAEQR